MLAFLSALPVIGNIVSALTTAFFNAKVELTKARVGGDRDVAVELVKTQAVVEQQQTQRLSVISGSTVLTFLILIFALPLALFEWQAVVYDKIWMHGLTSTDPITGQIADWANTIIASIFGSSTVMALGNLWFNKRST